MHALLTAIMLGTAITVSGMPGAVAEPGLSIPPGLKVVEEQRLAGDKREILIRRYVNTAGEIVRTTYYVKTGSFGFAPGTYNRYHDIVEPRFDADGRDKKR